MHSLRTPQAKRWLAASVLLALAGTVLVLYHTRLGPGTTGDSVSYIMGAETLLDGQGYGRLSGGGEVIPITGFPPGYSVALAGAALLLSDMTEAARWMNAILFGVNILLAGVLVWKSTGSTVFSLLAQGWILLSDSLLHIHSWVMSEGLFIFLMLLSLLCLQQFIGRRHWLLLLGMGLAGAAATLVRFVGMGVIAGLGLALLTLQDAAWRRRLQDGLVFSLAALLPVAAWFARNALLADTLANRGLAYHVIDAELVRAFLGTANTWLFPLSLGLPTWTRAGLSALLLGVLSAAFVVLALRDRRRGVPLDRIQAQQLPWTLVYLWAGYVAVLLVNSLLLDASTSAFGAARYLMPLYVITGLFVTSATHYLTERPGVAPGLRTAAPIVLGFFVLVHGVRTAAFVANPGESSGYTGIRRNVPEVGEYLSSLDPERRLISNNVELVYVLAGRPAYAFPIYYDHYQERLRDDYAEQLDNARQRLAQGAVIVFYGKPSEQEQAALTLLGAAPVWSHSRFTFYALPETEFP